MLRLFCLKMDPFYVTLPFPAHWGKYPLFSPKIIPFVGTLQLSNFWPRSAVYIFKTQPIYLPSRRQHDKKKFKDASLGRSLSLWFTKLSLIKEIEVVTGEKRVLAVNFTMVHSSSLFMSYRQGTKQQMSWAIRSSSAKLMKLHRMTWQVTCCCLLRIQTLRPLSWASRRTNFESSASASAPPLCTV